MKHDHSPRNATEVDRLVGKRVKLARSQKHWGQNDLAEAIGVTPQQVQKYEAGDNRISVSRIVDISIVLGVPVTSFFTGLGSGTGTDVDHHPV